MAIVKCRECKSEVSTEAAKCPKCGAAPTKTHYAGQIIGGLVALGFLVYLFGGGIERSTSNEFIEQYKMAKKNGDASMACVQAGVIAASYLGIDEARYKRWKQTESVDCGAVGLPGLTGTQSSAVSGAETGSAPTNNAPAPPGVTDVMNAIERDVAKDVVAQYEIAKREGSTMQMCVQADMVAAAFRQAKDEANFRIWNKIKKHDCSKAGLPSP